LGSWSLGEEATDLPDKMDRLLASRWERLLPAPRSIWKRHGLGRSFGKLQIGRIDRATEVLVIEPDEHAAWVYRGDDTVSVARLRRPIDYAASEVGLLGKNHWSVPLFGTCTIKARREHDLRLDRLI